MKMIKLTNTMTKKEMQEWEDRSAMNTLLEAKRIKENSALMKRVTNLAKKEATKFQALAGGGSVKSKKTLSRPKKKTLKRR